ncbi:DMT family transporter [Leucobacter ruminantium]|uniref:EamA family transporter n=1 Tax=Leucobacter ruminantium TaxID=1289170 RepID=A0A939RYE7_9MICO|nr:EamA family transporter [Leucobacter ruminantium]MBO1805628.1 EamA family transporter [Leucobacter ruminantium]
MTPTPRTSQLPRPALPFLAILVAAALWGTTGTAATFAPSAGPLAIGAAALGVGGLLQAAVAARSLFRERRALRSHPAVIAAGSLAVAVYPLAFYSSMHLAGVAVGTVVSLGTAPIFSGVLERTLDGTRLSGQWLLAAALGIAGCALLSATEATGAGSASALGILLGTVAGFTYALYSRAAYRLITSGVSRASAMGSVFGIGGALLLPVLVATGAPLISSPGAFAVAVYMAVVPMFLGYVLFGYGLTRVPPSTATTLTLAEPAIAAVLAVVIVGERLTLSGWCGVAAITASLVVLALPARRGSP